MKFFSYWLRKVRSQNGEVATIVALAALGVITVSIFAGKQLVEFGTRFLPKAATNNSINLVCPDLVCPDLVCPNGLATGSTGCPICSCATTQITGISITRSITRSISVPTLTITPVPTVSAGSNCAQAGQSCGGIVEMGCCTGLSCNLTTRICQNPNSQIQISPTVTPTLTSSGGNATLNSPTPTATISVTPTLSSTGGSMTLYTPTPTIAPTFSPTPTKTPTPTPAPFYKVFVSSWKNTGNIGGLIGADQLCQAGATASGLSGTYKAWLSTDTINAVDRIRPVIEKPYKMVNGLHVADNIVDLTSGILDRPITVDEYRTNITPNTSDKIKTGTGNNGLTQGDNCLNWTSSAAYSSANPNNPAALGSYGIMWRGVWSFSQSSDICSEQTRMYCFETDTNTSIPTVTPITALTMTPTPTQSAASITPISINCPRGANGNLDCSLDGCVDTADVQLFRQDFGKSLSELNIPSGHRTPDLVTDSQSQIDTSDFEILRENYGSCST